MGLTTSGYRLRAKRLGLLVTDLVASQSPSKGALNMAQNMARTGQNMAHDTSGSCVVIRNCYYLQVGRLANGMGPAGPEEKIRFTVTQV